MKKPDPYAFKKQAAHGGFSLLVALDVQVYLAENMDGSWRMRQMAVATLRMWIRFIGGTLVPCITSN